MSIHILFTKSMGQLIAEVEERLDTSSSYVLKNPCVVQVGQGQLGLTPIMGLVSEDTLVLDASELLGGLFTPADEIRNHFSAQFGSGIELVTSPIIR